jgi:hypothetical protein
MDALTQPEARSISRAKDRGFDPHRAHQTRAGLIVSDLQVPIRSVIICNEHHP